MSKSFVNARAKNGVAGFTTNVVQNLNLQIQDGEFFSLLGPSGCGKTTLLRMISGLEQLTEGEIRFNGQRIDHLPAQARPFNMVFQKYALFPHLSVFENVAFGLRLKKFPTNEITERVNEVLALVNMSSFRDRLPETLSGGQSQRIAIARALVNRPKILLLDEPLSALDQKLREHMQVELKALQRKLGLTFIYVTHDQEEALALSDRIAVMNQGCLEQVSEPKDLYDEPDTLFTAQFVGPMTSFEAEFVEMEGNLATVRFQDHLFRARPKQAFPFPQPPTSGSANSAFAMIRPERFKLIDPTSAATHMNRLSGRVTQTVFRGTNTEVAVEVGQDIIIRALVNAGDEEAQMVRVGNNVCLAFDPKDTVLFYSPIK